MLVLGTVNGTTITAGRVIVRPTDNGGSASSSVVPFQRGAAATSKQVGQVPADYRQGSGTIVSGAAANKATEAALAAYPGGIVDRVVNIGNGEYEVHNIGVSWPHHVFVNESFHVVGANCLARRPTTPANHAFHGPGRNRTSARSFEGCRSIR